MKSIEQKYRTKLQEFCQSIGITFEFHEHDSDDMKGINHTITPALEEGGIYQTSIHHSTFDEFLTIIKEENKK